MFLLGSFKRKNRLLHQQHAQKQRAAFRVPEGWVSHLSKETEIDLHGYHHVYTGVVVNYQHHPSHFAIRNLLLSYSNSLVRSLGEDSSAIYAKMLLDLFCDAIGNKIQ